MKVTKSVIALGAIFVSMNAQHSGADSLKTSTPTIGISFDGAQPGRIEELIQSGKLPRNGGFATLIRQGTKAEEITVR